MKSVAYLFLTLMTQALCFNKVSAQVFQGTTDARETNADIEISDDGVQIAVEVQNPHDFPEVDEFELLLFRHSSEVIPQDLINYSENRDSSENNSWNRLLTVVGESNPTQVTAVIKITGPNSTVYQSINFQIKDHIILKEIEGKMSPIGYLFRILPSKNPNNPDELIVGLEIINDNFSEISGIDQY